MKYIKLFETHQDYEDYINDEQNLVLPNVSFCEDDRDMHYNPYVEPSFICKLTLNDGSVVNIEDTVGNGELTSAMTSPYSASCVSAEIYESCASIGSWVFQDCENLSYVSIGSSVTSIGESAFSNCYSLTDITIPNSVTSIGNNAFFSCTSLTYVSIGSSVTSIGESAFESCTSLTNITIPNSVTSIGKSAFQECENLTYVRIRSGVTSIGNDAFFSCTSLTRITVEVTTPPTLGSDALEDTNDCPIYVPSESVSTYKARSGWSTYASRIQAIQ